MSDSLWPHGLQHTRLLCPSLPPGVCSNWCPLSQWCHLTISSFVSPILLLPSIFPSIFTSSVKSETKGSRQKKIEMYRKIKRMLREMRDRARWEGEREALRLRAGHRNCFSFLLESSWFTMLFLLYSKVVQSYTYIFFSIMVDHRIWNIFLCATQ